MASSLLQAQAFDASPPLIPTSRQHTRRKPSATHPRRRQSSISSPNVLNLTIASASSRHQHMDSTESPNVVPSIDAWKDAHRLRDVAKKVGGEVEQFAEHLDAWKRQETTATRPASVRTLVSELRAVAHSVADSADPAAKEALAERQARKWRRKVDPTNVDLEQDSSDKLSYTNTPYLEELVLSQSEYNTWVLFEDMIAARHFPDARPLARTEQSDDRFAADGDTWLDFLASDSTAREQHLVLNWLQESADRDDLALEEVEAELDRASQRGKALSSQGWLDTRERLKSSKRRRTWDVDEGAPIIANQQGESLVYHMDPDALSRLQKKIEYPDETFEASFGQLCWEIFRRGASMSSIQSRCDECNELMKAVTMGAFSGTTAMDSSHSTPSTRYRWRLACRSAAHRGHFSEYERAVFGFIGGDLKSIEPICESWEDYYLAQCNAQLIARYQRFVCSKFAADLPPSQLYRFASQYDATLDLGAVEILDSVRTYPLLQGVVQPESAIIQQSIISNELLALLVDCGCALGRRDERPSFSADAAEHASGAITGRRGSAIAIDTVNSLRLLAHFYIIVRELNVQFSSESQQTAAENVLIAYMDVLLLADKYSLLPTYAKHLSPGRAISTLADILTNIKQNRARRQFLRLMDANDFDVPLVLTMHYGNLAVETQEYFDTLPAFEQLELVETTREHAWPGTKVRLITEPSPPWAECEVLLIDSLEWFDFIQGHWFQTFGALTDAAVRLLVSGRYHTLLELVRRVVPSQLSWSKTSSILGKAQGLFEEQDPEAKLPQDLDSEPQKIQSERRYLEDDEDGVAIDRQRVAMKTKGMAYFEIAQLCEAIFSLWEFAQVASSSQSRDSQRELGIDENTQLRQCLDEVKATMEPLLQPHFLTTATSTILLARDEVEVYLRKIREAYLPELVMAYISVLGMSANTLAPREGREAAVDGIELANAIADDKELCRCFQERRRTRELMDGLAQCSRALLKSNELAPHSKSAKGKKRSKGPNKYAVWDVSV